VSKVTILNVLLLGLYFIPTILIFVIFFFSKKYIGKYSILLKTLSYIAICILVNFHISILAYTLSFSLGCNVEKSESYNPIRPISEYNKLVKNRTTRTEHFPDKIPPNATNVELYRNYMFHGDVEEYLKFNIDDEYINNELKNYHYTTIITGDKYTGHPPHGRMKNKDDVYYILGDLLQMHRGYSYGIVVNKKTYEIIYYYSSY
jgi:energy-coupling factor transporter transmembrane protein EcfT